MKITIIAPNSFGYIQYLVDELNACPNTQTQFINFSEIKYSYKSFFDRVYAFFCKTFFNKNIKKTYKSDTVLQKITESEFQDYIVVIRPDQLQEHIFPVIQKQTNSLLAFYFDAIHNFPKKRMLIPYFDKVYSYEKNDVKTYNLSFITNFIYDTNIKKKAIRYKVFNISSYDKRFKDIEKISAYLYTQKIAYKTIVRKEEPIVTSSYLDVVSNYMNLEEVKSYIEISDILLDVQKENQYGLSFRVFEALGYEKKLLTTNVDIKNYDFYNPNNIYIIEDVDAIHIPKDFFETPYEPISEKIIYPYTIKGWIAKVFHN